MVAVEATRAFIPEGPWMRVEARLADPLAARQLIQNADREPPLEPEGHPSDPTG